MGSIATTLRPRFLRPGWAGGLSYDRKYFLALRKLRNWRPNDLILDVGANDGRTVHRLMACLPKPHVVAFESASETFQRLSQAVAEYPNVECVQVALSATSGEGKIHLNPSPALNSLEAGWCANNHGSETVRLDTLDRFLAQRGCREVALLKIDAEGHDLEVLRGAQESLMAGAIELIQVEAGFRAPGRPQPSLESFQDLLSPFDYYLYGIFNQCRANLAKRMAEPEHINRSANVLVYCDALFVRGGNPAL